MAINYKKTTDHFVPPPVCCQNNYCAVSEQIKAVNHRLHATRLILTLSTAYVCELFSQRNKA